MSRRILNSTIFCLSRGTNTSVDLVSSTQVAPGNIMFPAAAGHVAKRANPGLTPCDLDTLAQSDLPWMLASSG